VPPPHVPLPARDDVIDNGHHWRHRRREPSFSNRFLSLFPLSTRPRRLLPRNGQPRASSATSPTSEVSPPCLSPSRVSHYRWVRHYRAATHLCLNSNSTWLTLIPNLATVSTKAAIVRDSDSSAALLPTITFLLLVSLFLIRCMWLGKMKHDCLVLFVFIFFIYADEW